MRVRHNCQAQLHIVFNPNNTCTQSHAEITTAAGAFRAYKHSRSTLPVSPTPTPNSPQHTKTGQARALAAYDAPLHLLLLLVI